MDYNTDRPLLKQLEYGREIQKMVDYAVTLENKEERQACAQEIIRLMAAKAPQIRDNENYEQMLWDHLYLMSGKTLDIEWPFDVTQAEKISVKPAPMPLKKANERPHVRHYGHLIEELFAKLQEMPEGPERDALATITANQMRKDLIAWGHGSTGEEKVIDDLARYTNGVIQLNPETFSFEKVFELPPDPDAAPKANKKKQKK